MLAACQATPAAALQDAGEGEYRRESWDVLAAARAPPLSSLGREAFRFSATPALGGTAIIFTLYPRHGHPALARAQFFEGHPSIGWTRTGDVRFGVSMTNFERLTAAVDGYLAKSVPSQAELRQGHDASEDEIILCTDGPAYVTERRTWGADNVVDRLLRRRPSKQRDRDPGV
jgi:hypothetical protein